MDPVLPPTLFVWSGANRRATEAQHPRHRVESIGAPFLYLWELLRPGTPFRYVSDEPFEHDVQLRVPDVRKARDLLVKELSVARSASEDEIRDELDSMFTN